MNGPEFTSGAIPAHLKQASYESQDMSESRNVEHGAWQSLTWTNRTSLIHKQMIRQSSAETTEPFTSIERTSYCY